MNILLFEDLCESSSVARVMLTLKIVLKILLILLPIILIIMSIISLSKVIKTGSQEEINNNVSIFIKRFIACLFVFAIPSLINYIFDNLVEQSDKNLLSCYQDVSLENIKEYEQREQQKLKDKDKEEQEKQKDAVKDKKTQEEKNNAALNAYKDKQNQQVTTNQYQQSQKDVTVTNNGVSNSAYNSKIASMSTPTMEQLQAAASKNGIDADYLKVVIGTTQREGYVNDPYLYYGWASAMINNKTPLSQMQGWDPYHSGEANYYSQTNINNGVSSATDTVLKSVYLALTERNTKIVECNGMYKTTPSSYNLVYASSVYNCSIYEKK